MLGDPLRHPVGDARHDHAPVAVPDEDDVVQILELEVTDDVFDVGVEIHGRGDEVRVLAEALSVTRETSRPFRRSSRSTSLHSQPPCTRTTCLIR